MQLMSFSAETQVYDLKLPTARKISWHIEKNDHAFLSMYFFLFKLRNYLYGVSLIIVKL